MRALGALLLAIASTQSLPCHAQIAGASGDGRASATVVEPVRIRLLEDLSFGAVTVGRQDGGEISISPGSSAAYSGSVAPLCGQSSDCDPHPARFAVSGEPGRTYRVQFPATVTARGRDTGQSLQVSSLTMISRSRPGADQRGAFDGDGRDLLEVGGVLAIPAGIRSDTFRAELSISVSYD